MVRQLTTASCPRRAARAALREKPDALVVTHALDPRFADVVAVSGHDGLRLPVDVTGSTEGQLVCRHWSARLAFARTNRTTELYQYTDTPTGTYWCSTQTGTGSQEEFSITFGVPFADAKWFRGRETTNREQSRCPDASCCRRPDTELSRALRSAGVAHTVIGDAIAPRKISDAVLEGFTAGYAV